MKVKIYDEAQMRREIEKAEKQGRHDAIDGMILYAIWAIHDVLDPGPEKIQECLDFMMSKSQFILSKEVSFSDISEMLLAETGIKVGYDKERFR